FCRDAPALVVDGPLPVEQRLDVLRADREVLRLELCDVDGCHDADDRAVGPWQSGSEVDCHVRATGAVVPDQDLHLENTSWRKYGPWVPGIPGPARPMTRAGTPKRGRDVFPRHASERRINCP